MDVHSVVGNCTKNGQIEWNNEQVSGVNKEEACQIAIPFADERQAATSAMEESPYYMTLSGTWKFHWVADPEDRPKDFYRTDYDVSRWDDIKVPATWQIEAVRNNKTGTSHCTVTLSIRSVAENILSGRMLSNLVRQIIRLRLCLIL